jgi:rubredoxin
MLDEAWRREVGEGDYVEFLHAGTAATGEFRCSNCGYGVTVQTALPLCPMCAGSTWESSDGSTFTRQRRLQ